ncbi:MAG TPA: hypothetical protein VND95_06480 [Stellaceae bacterium]|nr:hypothetical protein [Stellaceae bacterium]
MLPVGEGLHALRIGELAGAAGVVDGMAVPAVQVAAPPAGEGSGVEIVAAFPGRGPWLGREGGTMILRSPPGGGCVIVTAYGAPGEAAAELPVELQRLAGPTGGAPAEAAAPAGATAAQLAGTRDVASEILLHIERAGDRLFPGRGWVGALGRRMRIEAFSIRPLERLAPADIEMKGFLPSGGETPWIPGGVLCGTRGRGLPLIGFAVRVAPQRADRFEVAYQGSFFAGGISEICRNGEPCRAAGSDDPLEAVNVRLIERVPQSEAAATAG